RAAIDYGAKMVSDHKGRFGLFAPLNMIDVDSSLKELEYAYDQAHADGIGLQTSYNGKYPGDPAYKPILEELNHRKAVVFLHGPNAACCSAIQDGPGVYGSVVEVTFDATRAAVSLLTSGSLVRYPDIKWILPYGGGTLPFDAGRIEAFVNGPLKPGLKAEEIAPHGIFAEFGKLYYDTVNVTNAASWASLMKLAGPRQTVYGTDFIYFNNDQLLNIDKRVSGKDKEMILSGNAKRILPRLAKA
ncbi:MAG TPA: amidohydrolase family protein, partial [Stellaceae bacterium]|nr:amidohydrolase family protein [Stellaceae bacterium]